MTTTQGQQDSSSGTSDFNVMDFIIHQRMARITTMKMVLVKSVSNAGGVSPVGTVSVSPIVTQQDGAGNTIPHGVIYNVPYIRLQGGTNAIIMDPQVGDIGWCGFCDRDHSNVLPNAAALQKGTILNVPPGTKRKYDLSDAIYLGGLLNGAPVQYIQFLPAINNQPAAINVVSLGKITMTDGTGSVINLNGDNTASVTATNGLTLNANTKINGTLETTGATKLDSTLSVSGTVNGGSSATFSGNVTGGSIDLQNHVHPGVTSGGSSTGAPVG